MDFSIVIPTWNRSKLVKDLLESLFHERNSYTLGKTEVLIVDSSQQEEKQIIVDACNEYDAIYIAGDDSVRKKRNLGIHSSQYEHILFIDSDVTVEKGILLEYVQAYSNPHNVKLGGVLGYTEFVGKKTFWWKLLEKTSLVDSFSFAQKYPFHSWTICNNVSFKKSVLIEIGMFEENFPFKLGGDDLDMSYRVTKAGYMISSAPNAVTYHSRETWDNYKAVHDRAKRWGTMENYIVGRHPEIYRNIIPKNYVIEIATFVWLAIISWVMSSILPLCIGALWVVIDSLSGYIIDMKNNGFCSPVYYYGAKSIQSQYEYYRIKQSLKNRSLSVFYKGIVFNRFQIKYGMKNESFRIKKLIVSFAAAAVMMSVFWIFMF